MFNLFSLIIFICVYFFILLQYSSIQSYQLKSNEKICFADCFSNDVQINYLYDKSDHSNRVWFTLGTCWNGAFDFYRYILRSVNILTYTSDNYKPLTNFTELLDYNNSLRIYNLDSGIYEICIEFQINQTQWIYQPRNACILIPVGELLHESYKQDPTSLLIALAIGIVLFFILGLVVQRIKVKRKRRDDMDDIDDNPRSRSSSVLSMTSFKQHRDRLVNSLFHRHIEQPRISAMRQWARDRAFRHRISTQDQDIEKPKRSRRWSKSIIPSRDPSFYARSRATTISSDKIPTSEPVLATNRTDTISDKKQNHVSSTKISFHLSPSEEYEMT
ncbi:hypothetical protein I4U23_008444 [Adineta vaga]|nr:hypothetical protein I4U23_008444 [Adineta vaga]